MRELTMNEMQFVVGGFGCQSGSGSGSGGSSDGGDSGNTYGGISDTTTIGNDIINFYEGLVQATSHIIERVATSF